MTAEIQQYQNDPYCLDVEESIQVSSVTASDAINSYTMDMSGSPDMYTLSPQASGVYITSAHHVTNM